MTTETETETGSQPADMTATSGDATDSKRAKEPRRGRSIGHRRTTPRQTTIARGLRGVLRPSLTTILVFLIVAVSAAGCWLFGQIQQQQLVESRNAAVLTAARGTVLALLTITPKTANDTLADLENRTTGEFKQQLVAQRENFNQVVTGQSVNATGTISEAGIQAAGSTDATVMISAVGQVKNTDAPQGEPRQYHIVVGLHRGGDTAPWLVSKLDFVP